MKTILLNFLSLVRRFKMTTILNMLCVIGSFRVFAAFTILMMQVKHTSGATTVSYKCGLYLQVRDLLA